MNWPAIRYVFSQSIKETFSGYLWKFFTGSFPALIFLLFFGKNYFGHTIRYSITAGVAFLSLIVIIRFFLRLGINSQKQLHFIKREAIYGDAIILLKDTFAKAHLYRKTVGHQDKEFLDSMIAFCICLKKIFDNKMKGVCSVSIKVPIKGAVKESTSLRNLCRDPYSYKVRETESYKKLNHTILGNTAFQKALNNTLKDNKKKYYLNNDISSSKDYENTSYECYEGKLPYKSELVYPIIPNLKDKNNNYDCLGFLCIDCSEPNTFDEHYDVAIVEGVVDGIYDLLSERAKFLNTQEDGENQRNAV